ncbi:MAG: hypothetical protein ACI8P9_001788 [Parasphingorhabdus sp.]|jgi:hypothetical protein
MNSHQQLLNFSAHIHAEGWRLNEIARLSEEVSDWQQLVRRSEPEGIAPILLKHLIASGAKFPGDVRNKLRGLSIRHRHASSLRAEVFADISNGLKKKGVTCVGLKGIVLCSMIYPEPGLRPMRDIDLLISDRDVGKTCSYLVAYGFSFAAQHPSRYMNEHHHLPNATYKRDDLLISLEVHTKAISGDAPGTLDMQHLVEPLQTVESEFGPILSLGHIDMLNQLTRHALEPGRNIRLLSVMDILGYASTYFDQIDWPKLTRLYPYLPVAIGLMDYITPLPDNLQQFKPAPLSQKPADIGKLIPTAGSLSNEKGSALLSFLALNRPPEWWLRCYYGVPAEENIHAMIRLKHAFLTTTWMLRRLKAVIKGKFTHR